MLFKRVSTLLDLVSPLPISRDASSGIEYKYILTCIDISSRYVELQRMTNSNADELVDQFHWLCRYPRCLTVLTDQGTNFYCQFNCRTLP